MDAIVLGRFQVQELERRVITNTVDPTLVRLSCWYCGLEHCGQIGAARLAAAAYIDGWRVIGQHGQVLQPVVACPVHVPLGTITLPTESEQPEEKKKCEFLGGA